MHRALTKDERATLKLRFQELNALLRPAELAMAEMESAQRALGTLYGQYPQMRDPAETALGIAATMAKEFPIWAIIQSCDDVYHRRVYDTDRKTGARSYLSPDFPVSGVRLGQVALAHIQPLKDEQTTLGVILSAEVRPEPLPENAGRIVKPVLPVLPGMPAAQSAAEAHHQAQRKAVQDKLADSARQQQQNTIAMLYRQRGIAPKRTKAGDLIHPDLIDHEAWAQQEAARESTDDDALHASGFEN